MIIIEQNILLFYRKKRFTMEKNHHRKLKDNVNQHKEKP